MGWLEIIPSEILVLIVGSIITFFTTRRKYMADSKDLENQVTKSIFATYKEEFDSMKKRINDYVLQIDELENASKNREKEYIKRIEELEKTVKTLVLENDTLKNELAGFKKKYNKQKKDE